MAKFKSDFLNVMEERGFTYQCTDSDALDALMGQEIVTGYIGFDATADSLHVGSLIQIMRLRWLQKCGHKPIVLMGGGTTKIGDPSEKDQSRPILTDEFIWDNITSIQTVFDKFLKFGTGKTDATMVNNAEWLDKLEYIPFLRDVGKHFSVNRMIAMESVKQRFEREQSLSFLEFNYMILQAYDFVELYKNHGCRLQMSGSDQWGNIVNGIDLGRRMEGVELFGLTSELLTTASGKKMGKTESGAVWLNADKFSSYDYYQFWRNTEDGDVGRFLRLFTELPISDIEKLEALQGIEINEAKKVLALEATTLCHGEDAAAQAAETARQTFEEGKQAQGLPSVEIDRAKLEAGISILVLLREAGLVESNGEGKRLIKGGGARLNDSPVESDDKTINLSDLSEEGTIKLSAGKKRHALLKITA